MTVDARIFWFVIGTSWGALLVVVGIFMYIWAVNMSPLYTLAQVACNVAAISNVLSQACSKVNMNTAILSYIPDVAVILIILGCILLVMGLHISTGKEQGGQRRGSWNGRYF